MRLIRGQPANCAWLPDISQAALICGRLSSLGTRSAWVFARLPHSSSGRDIDVQIANVAPPIQKNPEQCRDLAHCLDRLTVRPDPYLKRPADDSERRQEANFWFYITAICQSTRTFEGTVDGQWVRGWDYLVRCSRRRYEDFQAQRMRTYSANDLRSLLSDDFDPDHSPIDRVAERLGQLHDCARRLLCSYGGQAMGIFEQAEGRLLGAGGLLELLSEFAAYADPLHKKSVLLAGMLHEVGIWPLRDAHNLKVAMDYHAMRVALRTGMVEVVDAALAGHLRERRPVSDDLNQMVRATVSAACDLMIRESGLSVFAFEKFIWHLGRSCCFYEHDPICGPGRTEEPCFKRDTCSFLAATSYACPDVCVFDGVCKGSRDRDYAAYWETNIYTTAY